MARRNRRGPAWPGGSNEPTPVYGPYRSEQRGTSYGHHEGTTYGQFQGADYGRQERSDFRRFERSDIGQHQTAGYGRYHSPYGTDYGRRDNPRARDITSGSGTTEFREYGQYHGPTRTAGNDRATLERRAESLRNELRDIERQLGNTRSYR